MCTPSSLNSDARLPRTRWLHLKKCAPARSRPSMIVAASRSSNASCGARSVPWPRLLRCWCYQKKSRRVCYENCWIDEGGPLDVVFQEKASNHFKLLERCLNGRFRAARKSDAAFSDAGWRDGADLHSAEH